MTKLFSKKYWLSLGSLLAVSAGIVWACADGGWDEYGISSFTPEAFNEGKSSPFFYSSNFYYGIGHDNEQISRFNSSNLAEWATYLQSNDSAAINFLLTVADSNAVKAVQQYHLQLADTLPADARPFALLQQRPQQKLNSFLNYLVLAKTAETFANVPYYWWGNEADTAKKVFDGEAFGRQLQQAFDAASNDDFLQQRICFQQIRNWFFNGQPEKAVALFDTKVKMYPKNIMYYRSMCYAAGALYKLKKISQANYYFSQVYHGCPALRTTAHFSFKPQEEKDWQATLALCNSTEEKITLWQMLGIFYGDEKRSIANIFSLDAKSDKLALLLTRAINIEELRLFGDYGNIKIGKSSKPIVSPTLLTQVTNIAKAANTADPLLWHCAAGYLQMLNGNFKAADLALAKAESLAPQRHLQQWQLRLLKLLNKTAAATKVDATLENSLLADLNWLQKVPSVEENAFRYANAFDYVRTKLAGMYKKQGDVVKAACFSSTASYFANSKNAEDMKNFLLKKDKSAYEQICEKLYPFKATDIFEYQAIQQAFNNQLAAAITTIQQAGDKAQYQLMGNPFNGKIIDCHDCEHTAYKGQAYTKMSLLQKMKDMQDQVNNGKDVFNNALLLGNAYYNITHYGNARLFYESAILGTGHYAPFAIDTPYKKMLTSMQWATFYYQKALAAATNNEQKARCTYLLAKCERNEWYNKQVYSQKEYSYDSDMLNLKAMTQFKALQQFKDTKYYADIIAECGYFKRYVGR